MTDFHHDWEAVLRLPGFRKALLEYGRSEGSIKANGRLPRIDLNDMASVAIRSRPALFSLEDRLADMGSVYVRCFAGYYWSTAFDDIDGPFDTLEKAVDTRLSIASDSAPLGFYVSASSNLPDAFIASRCVNLVEIGKTFAINGTIHVSTKDGLVPK
ncbi:MAG: hypothetical protein RJA48_500 [Verrucomicrobiota bacterium]|jgi:hypothetical protein